MKKFIFYPCNEKDAVTVQAGEEYTKQRGYGFLPFSLSDTLPADKYLMTAGWLGRDMKERGQVTGLLTDTDDGVQLVKEGWPLRFCVDVPKQGNYAVTVKLDGGYKGVEALKLYCGRRNMAKRDISIEPGCTYSYRFYTHIGDYIAVMGKPPRLDSAIYLSILGKGAVLKEVCIENADVPTLFIAGDSIVADYEGYCPYNPIINGGSWGNNLLQYFSKIAVDNQAHGGMTTNCFRDDGHWDIVSKAIKPGDVFLFQFGHNDQKRRNLAAFGGYSSNLRWYIHNIKEKEAYPIIVTPLSRIPESDENGFYDLLEEHADACRKVGREWGVPVLDLHQYSFEAFCKMKREELVNYFNDAAHTNDYGALWMAEFIAKEIKKQGIRPLSDYIINEYPSLWMPNESLRPAGGKRSDQKAEKPVLSIDLPELPYADCIHIRHLDKLKKAMALGLLDPCIKFFHPFDEMPRGQFFFLFFKAYKLPAKRPYVGKYCDLYKYEFDSGHVQAAIDDGLIDAASTPKDRFRPDDGLTGGELLSIIVRSLHARNDREFTLLECEQQARSLGLIWEGYSCDGFVNRADCVTALVHMLELSDAQILSLPVKAL